MTSARPEESVIQYQLLNGCPAVVIPVKVGAPLVAWDCLTLEQLWKVKLPPTDSEGAVSPDGKFDGIVTVIFEFLDLCVDWKRLVLPQMVVDAVQDADEGQSDGEKTDAKMKALKDAVGLLVAAAIRSGESKEVKHDVDKERSGIAMWRIP